MSPRLIVSDNRDDPGNPLVLDDEAIDAAAQDPGWRSARSWSIRPGLRGQTPREAA
jgi:hypothetical protein